MPGVGVLKYPLLYIIQPKNSVPPVYFHDEIPVSGLLYTINSENLQSNPPLWFIPPKIKKLESEKFLEKLPKLVISNFLKCTKPP